MNGLNNVEKFKLCCAKIIPLVYEESLSYYEFLCKVLDAVNKLIDNGEILEESFAALNERVGTFDGRITANTQNLTTYKELLDEDIDKLATLTADADGVTIKELVDKFTYYYTKDEANARFAQITYLNNNFVKQTDRAETLYGVNASGVQQSFDVTRNARPQTVARYKGADDNGFGKLVVGAGVLAEDAVNVGQMNEKLNSKETTYNARFVRKQPTTYTSLYGTNSTGSDIMYDVDADAATGHSVARRTSDGRLKANDPIDNDDVVTRNYLNTITDLDEIAAAVDRVNEATELANAAADAANEAATTAAGYETRIVNLENRVTAVDGRAQAAQTTATEAKQSATSAGETAATALSTANTANTKADDAINDAGTALTNSVQAQADASDATRMAQTAQSAAIEARALADVASGDAASALTGLGEKLDKSGTANIVYGTDADGQTEYKVSEYPTPVTGKAIPISDEYGVLHASGGADDDTNALINRGQLDNALSGWNGRITYTGTVTNSTPSGFELGKQFTISGGPAQNLARSFYSITLTFRNRSGESDGGTAISGTSATVTLPLLFGTGTHAVAIPFMSETQAAYIANMCLVQIPADGNIIITVYDVLDANYITAATVTRIDIPTRLISG